MWGYSTCMARTVEIEHLPVRVTERGRWLHGGTPLHPRVSKLFARSIVPHEDGRYSIVLRGDEEVIEVEDTAFFVESMSLSERDDGLLDSVLLRISDGREEPLDPRTLMISAGSVLYARVIRHGLSVPCRFPPSLYHRLALHVEEDRDDGFVLPLGGKRWPIGPYNRRPAAADRA